MDKSPKGMRLHIALMGRVNSGKSSFLNLVAGQDISITSAEEGTMDTQHLPIPRATTAA